MPQKPPRVGLLVAAFLALLATLILLLVFAPPSHGYANGQIPPSARAPIASGTSCNTLSKPAAAAYNTMALQAGRVLPINGCLSAYRDIDGQVKLRIYWCSLGSCGNAAPPGSSTHGLGVAVDASSSAFLQAWRTIGRGYGWCCYSAAPWEIDSSTGQVWHHNWLAGVWTQHPDPGPDVANPVLRKRSGGPGQEPWVTKAQDLLRKHGYAVKLTGYYGSQTKRAVRRFQSDKRLGTKSIDGVIGRNTWTLLRADPRIKRKGETLLYGDRGPGILSAQKYLTRRGFPQQSKAGYFGASMKRAVRRFQRAKGLTVSGIVDSPTWAQLERKRKPAPKPRPAPARSDKKPTGRAAQFADISGNNASVDFGPYRKAKHKLVVIKLTEGATFTSSTGISRYASARREGLIAGAYDFARPSSTSCTAEADNFGRALKQVKFTNSQVAILDWEDQAFEGRGGDGWVVCYRDRLLKQWRVTLDWIYGSGPYVTSTLRSLHDLRYWLACYCSSPATTPAFARKSLVAWQFTDGVYGPQPHSLPGIGQGDGNQLLVPFSGVNR